MPLILAQKDFLLFASLVPFLSSDGGVVTAVFKLEPGFSFLYESTPF
tara:strand:- start:824 stop:964 length:141 start_codon:yes stop_codon:yes gene_type:complete